MPPVAKTVLFLCTGNYYRSRFAEEFFNHRAQDFGLIWTANSRGLAIERLGKKAGVISQVALKRLRDRKCVIRGNRPPQQCTVVDLTSADHIIALDRLEHRSLMRELFPAWAERVEYWDVGDIGVATPEVALTTIEQQIEALVLRLPRR